MFPEHAYFNELYIYVKQTLQMDNTTQNLRNYPCRLYIELSWIMNCLLRILHELSNNQWDTPYITKTLKIPIVKNKTKSNHFIKVEINLKKPMSSWGQDVRAIKC